MRLEPILARAIAAPARGRNTCLRSLPLLLAALLFAVPLTGSAQPITLDFETDDFGNPLVNGQSIQVGEEFGNFVNISKLGGSNLGPAIYDSDPGGPNADGEDDDLLVGRGNILILQENNRPDKLGDIFEKPSDEQNGGTILLEFLIAGGVEVLSVDLIDIDDESDEFVNVKLIDFEGNEITYHVPQAWTHDIAQDGPNGFATLDLTSTERQRGEGSARTSIEDEDEDFDRLHVVRMEIELGSSAAIDNLVFVPEPGSAGLLGLAFAGLAAARRLWQRG